jgi:hypothetical protein
VKDKKPPFWVVVERSEEFEQCLCLKTGPDKPAKGILDWMGKNDSVALFPSYKEAADAIRRSMHYRLAFGREDLLPEAKNCKIKRAKPI